MMNTDSDIIENIKACRTCGIHYVSPAKHQLRHLFQQSQEQSEIQLILHELSQWNVEVAENDGFPQYVCNSCIHKFDQVFQLRAVCINAQNEFRKFYAVSNGNIANVKIKSEIPEPDEEPSMCDFIYVDDLSDSEYDGATPFNIPHIPIKEEIIEAATIPMEESQQPMNLLESASRVVVQTGPSSSHEPELISPIATASQSIPVQLPVDEIECNMCQYTCPTLDAHKQHMESVHDIRDLECHICGKEFNNTTTARFKFHIKWHNLNKPIKCTICGYVCNSKAILIEHKRTNHRKISCKVCGKGILAKKMKYHLRQHEQQSKYPCGYCTEAFGNENERENHIWEIHANEDTDDPSSSMATFQTENENFFNLPQQDIVCQEPQADMIFKFVCAHCEHRFIDQIDLETHVNEIHRSHLSTIERKSVEEAQCNEKSIVTQNEEAITELDIPVFVDNCNEVNNFAGNLSLINSSSALQQDFLIQSSSTVQTTSLQNGESIVATNSDSDESVDKTETSSNLSYIDINLNTFACAKCVETFDTIENLRNHHEKHLAIDQQRSQNSLNTKSKFQCNLCGKSFGLKFRLNRHVKKHKQPQI